MANETIIIDVQSKFTDNASAGLKSAGLQADRYKTKLDGATKASEKLGGTKVKPKLGAPTDHATPVFKKVLGLGRSFGRKTYKATVDVNDQASGKIRGLSSKIFSLKSLLTGVTAGVAAKKAIIDPIGVADFSTTAQIGFETMLGSKKKADKFMRDVKNFAVDTPFETQDVVSNAQRMLSVGWNRKNVLKDMNRIGNQSAATGTGAAGIERVTTALGQMRMKGKGETQGGMGIENELEEDDIASADAVILAVAIGIEGEERFEEKEEEGKVITIDPSVVIKNPAEIIDQAEKL